MRATRYLQPAHTRNAQGTLRHVGFELEFSGLSLYEAAQLVADSLQGRVEHQTEAECKIHTALGEFQLELDWQFYKKLARERADARQQQGQTTDDQWMRWLTRVAQEIIPLEVVCPPVPLDALQQLDVMIEAMRKLGAVGTGDAPHFAFGVHINTEIPDHQASTLLAYLQAYGLAQDWLIDTHHVDLMRRLTPYIDKYPTAYLNLLLGYPDNIRLAQLMDDYLYYNPTRNRALDMLPLFKYLDEGRIMATTADTRIHARPTFHYRLPNCEIEKPGWYLDQSWNIWCVIEHLACAHETRRQMIEQWQDFQSGFALGTAPWHPTLDRLYTDLLSA